MKKLLGLTFTLLFLSFAVSFAATAVEQNASGVYQIRNEKDFLEFAGVVNSTNASANGEVTSDIDMSYVTWTPLKSYSGTLNGNNHTISNLNGIVVETLNSGATVKSFAFVGGNFWPGTANAGRIVGTNSGTVQNCIVKDAYVQYSGWGGFGGAVGANTATGVLKNVGVVNGTFMLRFSASNETGNSIGGVIGKNSGVVENCYAYLVSLKNGKTHASIAFEADEGHTPVNCYWATSEWSSYETAVSHAQLLTAVKFQSGEACYRLNGGDVSQGWYQVLYDAVPSISGPPIYKVNYYYNCDKTGTPSVTYRNINEDTGHVFSYGVCKNCGAYDVPPLIDGWYNVSSEAQLVWISQLIQKGESWASPKVKLTKDISLSLFCGQGVGDWEPIGHDMNKFAGIFDGQGHTISDLYIANTSGDCGLFGAVYKPNIYNVNLENCYISGGTFVGGIVGRATEGTKISDCTVSGQLIASEGTMYIGGIGGYFGTPTQNTYINNSINNATITTPTADRAIYVGGIMAFMGNSRYLNMSSCLNLGKITADSNDIVGGLAGYSIYPTSLGGSSFENSYYLDTSAEFGSGVGKTPGSSPGGSPDTSRAVTQKQVASGEVAYKMNGGNANGTQKWHQTCGEGTPSYSGKNVYEFTGCDSNLTYTNDYKLEDTVQTHNYVDGICANCGDFEPAKLNNNGTASDTSDDYLEIASLGNFMWYGNNLPSDAAKLTCDIDLSKFCGEDVGSWKMFKGAPHLDGQGHKISNLYISAYGDYLGMFSELIGGYIRNVVMDNCSVTSLTPEYISYTGTIAGVARNAEISGCTATGEVHNNSQSGESGGLCGGAGSTTFESCLNLASVYGRFASGGIVGDVSLDVFFRNCLNIGKATGEKYVGGMCGRSYNGDYCIINSYYSSESASMGYGNEETTDTSIALSSEKIASGEICYILNKGTIDGTQKWYQTKGTDAYPVLDSAHKTVYRTYVGGFNAQGLRVNPDFSYENSIPSDGGTDAYQPITLNSKGYYEIANKGQLISFEQYVNSGKGVDAKAILTKDIDLNPGYTFNSDGSYTGGDNPYVWEPIGYYKDADGDGKSEYLRFNGIFDGGKYTIRGIYLSDATRFYIGLFGCTDTNVKITNLRITDSYLKGVDVGLVAGDNKGEISYIIALDSYLVTNQYAGGIAGSNNGNISYCFANCYETVTGFSGGIAPGYNGSVTNCLYLNTGATNGGGTFVKAEQIKNGYGCYYAFPDSSVIGQTIGEMEHPDFGGKKVYMAKLYGCNGIGKGNVYTNDNISEIHEDHQYENGVCTVCYDCLVPTLNNNGTPSDASDDYYEIRNGGNLAWLAQKVNASTDTVNAKQMCNIDLSTFCANNTKSWEPVGSRETFPFSGVYDGNGCYINGLYNKNVFDFGLFGYVTGTVKNVKVANPEIVYGNSAVICYKLTGGTLENCGVTGGRSVISNSTNYSYTRMGGICVLSDNGTIRNCYTDSDYSITADRMSIGGICNTSNNGGTIEGCENNASLTSQTGYAAGICASPSTTPISDCHNFGNIISQSSSGISGQSSGIIKNCTNYGDIETTAEGYTASGIASYGRTIQNCINFGDVHNADGNSAGITSKGYNVVITSCYNAGNVYSTTNNETNNGIIPLSRKTVDYYKMTNCYSLSGCAAEETEGTIVSREQLLSGEIAYKLNNGVSDGTQCFFQSIGVTFPKFSGNTVYFDEPSGGYYNQNDYFAVGVAEGSARVYAKKSATVTLIFACYDADGKLVSTDIQENVTLTEGLASYAPSASFTTESGANVTVMIFENAENLKPLCIAANVTLK